MSTKVNAPTQKTPSLLDVLIVTYNSEKFITSLLRQLSQLKVVKAIYIIDNNSTDNTIKQIFRVKSPKIFVLRNKENIGFGNAMNILFKKSKGEYKLLLNPDTKITANSLENLLECASTSSADITGGIMLSAVGRHQTSHTKVPNALTVLFEFTNLKKVFPHNRWSKSFHYQDQKKKNIPHEVGTISGGYMLVTDRLISKLNGFDPGYFMYLEDIDLCNRAHKQGYKIMFCPHSQIIHIGGASSTNKHKIHYEAWDHARIHYVRKNFSSPVSVVLEAIIRLDIVMTRHRRDK